MPPPLPPRVFQLLRRKRVAWFSTFQLTTTWRNRPISPPASIALARRHDASSGKLKSIIPGRPAFSARSSMASRTREIGSERLLDEYRLAAIERVQRNLRLPIRRHGNRHRVDRRIVDQCLPVADAARNVRRARELRGARRVGAGERHHLAARVGAERRDEDGPAVVGADDADADHRQDSRRRGQPRGRTPYRCQRHADPSSAAADTTSGGGGRKFQRPVAGLWQMR